MKTHNAGDAPPGLRVAVAGAGIGGLAAAAALSRRGVQADLYEQAPQVRDVGVGLHLAPNGSRLLQRMGLTEHLRDVAVRPEALEIRHWGDGRVLVRQPMGAQWEADFGAPYYTVQRADLHEMLASLVPPGRLHLGRRLTAFEQTTDGVRLTFADGTAADADVLVGADGIHSVVRAAIAGRDSPVFSGNSAFRAVLPASQLPPGAGQTMYVWAGPDCRLLCYPVSRGGLVTFVAVVSDPDWTVESWSSRGDPADLAKAFAGWDAGVQGIVAAVADTGRWALYDREPLPRWSAGRVTLLGDAAHPMLPHHGQGANQAIEDGVALAACLAAAPIEAGLRRYEELRRPHTTRVQLGSRGSGSLRLSGGQAGALPAEVQDVTWIQRYDVEQALSDSHIAPV